jgi:hypothetical protein
VRSFGASSGSSSEGVGKTLTGVFDELFRGVLVGAATGVIGAVDFLFLDEDREGTSYNK